MSGFNDPIVGGQGILKRSSIQSPNYIAGASGWSINKDGTAQFNQLTLIVQTSGAAVLVYAGAAGLNTLIGSWANAAGTDSYGNAFPAGLSVSQGALTGILLTNPQIVGATILSSILQGPTITNAAISAGSITETTITFDSTGGRLLTYSSSTTVVTQNVNGQYQITFPTTVTSAKVECWGADAGGGGGSSAKGGEAGGGGEYAREDNYPIVGGGTYFYTVGNGGSGGSTGIGGTDGTDTFFDNTGVYANAGLAGAGFVGGPGGSGSINSVHFNGGNGGGDGTQSTGGCGGGGRAGSTGAGGNGAKSTTSAGAAGGTAGTGTGGHAGGNGGAAAANGSTPSAGAGAGSAVTTITKTYNATSSRSWLGADGSPANSTRVSNSTMYQGGETASGGSGNGTQKSACLFNSTQIQSDFAGATMKTATFAITNQHSWYNSGLSVQIKHWPVALGTSLPSSWDGTGAPVITTPGFTEGQRKSVSLGATIAANFASGADRGIAIGPGPGSFNLNYYGYFNGTPNSSSGPQLTLSGTIGAGSTNAGDGQDGQVTITYTSGQTLISSNAPVAGTDQFGNAYPAGLGIKQPNGQIVKVSGAATDASVRTVVATGNNQMTALWSIPANDAAVGTVYRLTAYGSGTQGSTVEQYNTNLFLNGSAGTNIDNTNMSSAIVPASQNFHWRYQAEVIVKSTGVGGTCDVTGFLTFSQAVATTGSNAATSSLSDIGKAFNTTVVNTLGLFGGWGVTTGAPTITCNGSVFERIGP